jgi:excisionase family DNA binding protein
VTERLLTARQVADVLGVTPGWVLRQYQRGVLPGYRLSERSHPVRFRASEVEAWLETRRSGHGGPSLKAAG